MIDLGLTRADEAEFEDALAASHQIRITIHVHDHNEKIIQTLQPKLLPGGAVQVDGLADVTHSLSMSFLDPDHNLHFDASNPAAGALYADNFVSVKYGVWVEALLDWVDVPVFFGILTGFGRSGAVVDLEAQGKETLGLEPHLAHRGYTVRKGTTVKKAIETVMGRLGETRTQLGMLDGRLHRSRAIRPGEQPWKVCVGGAEDGNGRPKPALMSRAKGHFYLFYDGRGVLTAKRRNRHPLFTFTHTKHVLTQPGYQFDLLELINHAEVKGGVPKGAKHHVRGEYTLPASHPLSPTSLARNGRGRYLTEFREADNLKTEAACKDKARQIVEAAAHEGVEATFDSLVIPHLEVNDLVTLRMSTYSVSFPLRKFTIPLDAGSPMAVGYNKKAKIQKGKRRSF